MAASKLQSQLFKSATRLCAALQQYVAYEDVGARMLDRARNLYARARLFARAAVGDAAIANRIMGPLLVLPNAPQLYFNKHLSLLRQQTQVHTKAHAATGQNLVTEMLALCDDMAAAYERESNRIGRDALTFISAEQPLSCAALQAFALDAARCVAVDIAHKNAVMDAVAALQWSDEPYELVVTEDVDREAMLDAAAREWPSLRTALQRPDHTSVEAGVATIHVSLLRDTACAAWEAIDDYYVRLRERGLLQDADGDEPVASPVVRVAAAVASR